MNALRVVLECVGRLRARLVEDLVEQVLVVAMDVAVERAAIDPEP